MLVFTKFINKEKQINEFVENIEGLLDVYFKSNRSDVQLVSQDEDMIERYRNNGVQYEDVELSPLRYYGLFTVNIKVGVNFRDEEVRRIFKFLDFLASAWSAVIRDLNGTFFGSYGIDLYQKDRTQMWVINQTKLKADILRTIKFGPIYQTRWRIIYNYTNLKNEFKSVYEFLTESNINRYPKYKAKAIYKELLEKWYNKINERYERRGT